VVEYQCSLMVLRCSVLGLDLNAVVGVQVFLVDAEASGSGGLDVVLRQRGIQLLEEAGVEALGRDLGPEHLEGSSGEDLFITHHSLDLVRLFVKCWGEETRIEGFWL